MPKQDVVPSKRTSGRKTKQSSKVQTAVRPKAERWEKWEIERLRRYMLGLLKDNPLEKVKWNMIPYKADLQGTKTFKQCRERWKNHEDPNINKEEWTAEEDESLVGLYYVTPNR
jgi:hypothetical protein